MSAAQVRALRSLAEPVVAGLDCDLEDVTVRQAGRRRLVRVVVDHDGGLSLDLVAEISRTLSAVLDDSTILGESPYVLEVTSPGVDRPLTSPRHWQRAVGRLVAVDLHDGGSVQGRVNAADEQAASLTTDEGDRRVPYAEARRAVVQVEFSRIEDADLDEAQSDESDPDATDADDAAHAAEAMEAEAMDVGAGRNDAEQGA